MDSNYLCHRMHSVSTTTNSIYRISDGEMPLPSFPCKIRYPKLRPITLFVCTTAHNLQVSSTWLSWAMQWSEDRMSIFAGNIQFDALKHACRSRRIGNEEAKFAILKVLNWIEFHAHCASMKHLFWFFYWKIFKWKGKSNATSNMQNEMKAPNDLQMFNWMFFIKSSLYVSFVYGFISL